MKIRNLSVHLHMPEELYTYTHILVELPGVAQDKKATTAYDLQCVTSSVRLFADDWLLYNPIYTGVDQSTFQPNLNNEEMVGACTLMTLRAI